jgi:phosphoribosyl 1,2-cyclic phosphodiesterase
VLNIRFFGVRGSTPCSDESCRRYGGNTSCVVLEHPDERPIVFDLGTGLRFYGLQHGPHPFEGTALVTHLHWDHVQGLPFFGPLVHCGARLDVLGPAHEGVSLGEGFRALMRPPFFPINVEQLSGDVTFADLVDDDLRVGSARIMSRTVPHCGETNGYRVDWGGKVVAYISDHQEPVDDPTYVDERVLELAEGADVLIHDAQYTPEEFALRSTWGHCTVEYAVEVAKQAGAKQLVLFHHDPSHDDAHLDRLTCEARAMSRARRGAEVVSAYEGLQLPA